MTAWIAEPQTKAECEIELCALEVEIEQKLAEYRALQVEIVDLDTDRLHLRRLLAEMEPVLQCAG